MERDWEREIRVYQHKRVDKKRIKKALMTWGAFLSRKNENFVTRLKTCKHHRPETTNDIFKLQR